MASDTVHHPYYYSLVGREPDSTVRQFEVILDLDFAHIDLPSFGRLLGQVLTKLGEGFDSRSLVVLFHCYTDTRVIVEVVELLHNVQIVQFVTDHMQPVIDRQKVQFRMNVYASDCEGTIANLLLLNTAIVEHHRRNPTTAPGLLCDYFTEDRKQGMTAGVVAMSREPSDCVASMQKKLDMPVSEALKKIGL